VGIKEHGLNIFNGVLEKARFPDNYFDAITAGDILEHIADPKAFLREIYRILKEDGIAYIAVPNLGGFYYSVMGLLAKANHKNYFALPHHLFNFTKKTLGRLLRACGFVPLEIRLTESKIIEKGIHKKVMECIFFAGRLLGRQDRMVFIVKKETGHERIP